MVIMLDCRSGDKGSIPLWGATNNKEYMESIVIIASMILILLVGILFVNYRATKARGKVRYIFTSPQGEKIITDWKTFNQEEYDIIISVHTHPEEAQYIKTDHKGTETIISIPFILNGFVQIERR